MTDFVDYENAEKVLQADEIELRQLGLSEAEIEENLSFARTLQMNGHYGTTVRERHQMLIDGTWTAT